MHAVLPNPHRPVGRTAIDKRPVAGLVRVEAGGLAGDTQCDRQHHGGPYQAVYAYADEDAAWWSAELGREIPPGLFGENLRTSGVDVSGAEVGERWRIGEGDRAALLEVTSARIPCRTFAERMGERQWVKRFGDHGAPGAYLRVIEPGAIRAGDPLAVVERPGHGVTVADTFLHKQPAAMERLLHAADAHGLDLNPALRRAARQALARA